jgi:hypothetical protein
MFIHYLIRCLQKRPQYAAVHWSRHLEFANRPTGVEDRRRRLDSAGAAKFQRLLGPRSGFAGSRVLAGLHQFPSAPGFEQRPRHRCRIPSVNRQPENTGSQIQSDRPRAAASSERPM